MCVSLVILLSLLVSIVAFALLGLFNDYGSPVVRTGVFGNTLQHVEVPLGVSETNASVSFVAVDSTFKFSKQDSVSYVSDVRGELLAKEQVGLEVYQDGGWQSDGLLVNVEYVRVSDFEYRVVRSYEGGCATWKTIYDIFSGGRVKLTVEVTAKVEMAFRLVWVFDLPQDFRGQVDGCQVVSDSFFFDWSDVKRNFGDITTRETRQNQEALFFSLGVLSRGERLVLDPIFGSIGGNSSESIDAPAIRGSIFALTEVAEVTSLTVSAEFSEAGVIFVGAIYRAADLSLVAQTQTRISGSYFTSLYFDSPVLLQPANYILAVWNTQPLFSEDGEDFPTNYMMKYSVGFADQGFVINNVGESLVFASVLSGFSRNNRAYAIYATYNVPVGAPAFSNVYHNGTGVGSVVEFSSTWQSNVGLDSYIFSTNNTGVWMNDTAVSFTGNPDTVSVVYTLQAAVGDVVSYVWYANDTGGVWGVTPVYDLTVTDGSVPPAVYRYTLTGPFLESGKVFNGSVSVRVNYASQPSVTYNLSGVSGVADTVVLPSSSLAVNVVWNITSDGSYQRIYYFNSVLFEETVFVTVPDLEDPFELTQVYSISVVDFAGLSNAYVEVLRNINGVNTVVERQPLDVLNPMLFRLIAFQQYTLRVTSSQGSWSFPLATDENPSKNFVITRDMLPSVDYVVDVDVSVLRSDPAVVTVRVVDYQPNSGITTVIQYWDGSGWVEVFSQTDFGSEQIIVFDADPVVGYLVVVSVVREGGRVLSWQYVLPAESVGMQFTGFFEVLGSWPFPANQLIGLFLVGLFFTGFSWRDVDAACLIGCIVAGVCMLLGFLDISVMALSMGFFIVVALYVHSGKKGEFGQV